MLKKLGSLLADTPVNNGRQLDVDIAKAQMVLMLPFIHCSKLSAITAEKERIGAELNVAGSERGKRKPASHRRCRFFGGL